MLGIEGLPSAYLQAFRGSFTAALRWHQFDALWEQMRTCSGDGWYLYAVGERPPDESADAARVETFLTEMERLLAASIRRIAAASFMLTTCRYRAWSRSMTRMISESPAALVMIRLYPVGS